MKCQITIKPLLCKVFGFREVESKTLPTLMQIRQSLTNFLRDDEGLRRVTEILRGSILGKVIYLALGNTLVTFPPFRTAFCLRSASVTLLQTS